MSKIGTTGTAPVRPLQVARVEALRLNADGEGVAKINGMTVFVPNLLPGEWAKVRVISVEKSFARAVVLSREDGDDNHPTGGTGEPGGASDAPRVQRVAPLCPVFELCGGCQMQHIDYQHQLAHKRQVVVDALSRIGHLSDVEVLPTIGMSHPWRYRNQVQVPISFDPAARGYTSGFFAAGSHQRIATDVCFLISEALESTLKATVAVLTQARRAAGLGRDLDLGVHHLILRESRTTGQQMVIMALSANPVADFDGIFRDVAQLPNVDTVAYTVQPRVSGPMWGPTVEVVHGKGQLTENVLGLEYLISPRSFFQTNTEQVGALYLEAMKRADIKPDDTVLDAYCGAGSLSLLFAQRCEGVVGIDNVTPAIKDARRNAAHNGITNAEFRVGLVEQELPKLLADAVEGRRVDLVVLDPPRKGCHADVLRALASPSGPRRIVYVSCNPATLARDLRVLVDAGYEPGPIQPFDMFPQTSHVECCLRLDRCVVATD